jgi:hypothetical protein
LVNYPLVVANLHAEVLTKGDTSVIPVLLEFLIFVRITHQISIGSTVDIFFPFGRRIPDLVERSAATEQLQNEFAFVVIRTLGFIDLVENLQFRARGLERSRVGPFRNKRVVRF